MRKLLSLQQLPNLSYVPDASYAGTMYHSTTDSRLYASNGTAWKKIAFVDEISGGAGNNVVSINIPVKTNQYTITIDDSNATIGKSVFAEQSNGPVNTYGSTGPTGLSEWSSYTTTAIDVDWNGSVFCAVATTSTGVSLCATSPDGINWTNRPGLSACGMQYATYVTWCGDRFITVGYDYGTNTEKGATSPDGITWAYVGSFGVSEPAKPRYFPDTTTTIICDGDSNSLTVAAISIDLNNSFTTVSTDYATSYMTGACYRKGDTIIILPVSSNFYAFSDDGGVTFSKRPANEILSGTWSYPKIISVNGSIVVYNSYMVYGNNVKQSYDLKNWGYLARIDDDGYITSISTPINNMWFDTDKQKMFATTRSSAIMFSLSPMDMRWQTIDSGTYASWFKDVINYVTNGKVNLFVTPTKVYVDYKSSPYDLLSTVVPNALNDDDIELDPFDVTGYVSATGKITFTITSDTMISGNKKISYSLV